MRLGAAFVAIALFAYAMAARGPGATRALLASLAAVTAFIALVAYHDRLKASIQELTARAELNDLAVYRVDRAWSELSLPAWMPAPDGHPYANDLDLFGPASLAQLFPPMTALGRQTLRGWMLAGAPRDVVVGRQESVAELRLLVDMREAFAAQGRRRLAVAASARPTVEAWAEHGASGPSLTPAVLTAAALLVATVALGVGQSAGLVPNLVWLAPLFVGRIVMRRLARPINETIGALTGSADRLEAWTALARLIATQPFNATGLRGLQDALGSAWLEIQRLRRLADWASARESPMLHFALQMAVYWDLWIAWFAARWRARNGPRVAQWLAAIGTGESLAALATLASENPDWTFPELAEASPPVFDARAVGHPLLSSTQRVTNDVSLGPGGTLVLVTGSNMAGKSTLLRAIGLNVVLARTGSAACASALRLAPFRLWTVIRIQDSLERGVSYFMAELERLKEVVQAASASSDEPLLYLFDEILQGTNSAERVIAARRVLQHLMLSGAVGAVTSHDLALADAEAFAGRVQHVHFQEQIQGARMTFDYRVRPGKATSTNALKLLELVGLGDSG